MATLKPWPSRRQPMEAEARPLPRDETTPPVTKMYLRSEEHTSELQSRLHLVCRLLLEKKKKSSLHRHPFRTPGIWTICALRRGGSCSAPRPSVCPVCPTLLGLRADFGRAPALCPCLVV